MIGIEQVAVEVFGAVSVDDAGVVSPLPGLKICHLPGGHALVCDHVLGTIDTASTATELIQLLQDLATRRQPIEK